LFFLEDTTGQLFLLDKFDASFTPIGVALGASGNLALSPSDVETQLFASIGTGLVRINVVDGTFVPIVNEIDIEVNRLRYLTAAQINDSLFQRRWHTTPMTD
jgi:hypothetical protein